MFINPIRVINMNFINLLVSALFTSMLLFSSTTYANFPPHIFEKPNSPEQSKSLESQEGIQGLHGQNGFHFHCRRIGNRFVCRGHGGGHPSPN